MNDLKQGIDILYYYNCYLSNQHIDFVYEEMTEGGAVCMLRLSPEKSISVSRVNPATCKLVLWEEGKRLEYYDLPMTKRKNSYYFNLENFLKAKKFGGVVRNVFFSDTWNRKANYILSPKGYLRVRHIDEYRYEDYRRIEAFFAPGNQLLNRNSIDYLTADICLQLGLGLYGDALQKVEDDICDKISQYFLAEGDKWDSAQTTELLKLCCTNTQNVSIHVEERSLEKGRIEDAIRLRSEQGNLVLRNQPRYEADFIYDYLVHMLSTDEEGLEKFVLKARVLGII